MSRWVQIPPRPISQRAANVLEVKLSSSTRDGYVVVALCGEMDLTNVAGAEAAIAGLAAPGHSLILDMSALDFMDCASIGLLLSVQKRARWAGGDVVLALLQPLVRRLLGLTGADEVFSIDKSVAVPPGPTADRATVR